MTMPVARKNLPQQCTCGHPKAYHAHSGGAQEDNLGECTNVRCECTLYQELCPLCIHSQASHDGANGECMRIKQLTGQVCGCKHYA